MLEVNGWGMKEISSLDLPFLKCRFTLERKNPDILIKKNESLLSSTLIWDELLTKVCDLVTH